jgi:DegV family protein with EDD domain
MSKVGVLLCGNSGIDYISHEHDIMVIRSILLFGEEEYNDFVDITASEFYQKLVDNPDVAPSTAQAATGVILEQYEEMFAKGYDELFVISLSEKLSGTYAGCVMAANMIEDKKITVFDSKTVSFPEAKMGLTAAKMFEEGKSTEEVLKEMEFIRDNSMIWICVDTLKYLVKNGRLSGAAGFVGSLMKVKPLLEVTKEGKVESIEKIRTSSKATERLIQKLLEEIEGKDVEVFIIDTNNQARVDYVKKSVLAAKPELKDINVYPLTPVVGAHAGPGTIGLGYILKK